MLNLMVWFDNEWGLRQPHGRRHPALAGSRELNTNKPN